MRRPRGPVDWLVQIYWPTLPLAAWAIFGNGASPGAWLFLNLACWPLVVALSIAVHELGHALAGLALAFTPFRIRLGTGPVVSERTLGPLQFELRRIPMSGLTSLSVDSLAAIRLRVWLVFAAGPAVTYGLFRLGLMRSGGLSIHALAVGPAGWEILGFANAFLLFLNLLPVHLGGLPTDGRNLLLLVPWVPVERFAGLIVGRQLDGASTAMGQHDEEEARRCVAEAEARHPSSELVVFTKAAIDLMSGRFDEGREVFAGFLQHSEPAIVALARNNLAWGAFMKRDPELLAEALDHSERALATLPRHGAVHGTRGAVLFWAGQPDDARPRLLEAVELNEAPYLRAINACVLSMICVGSGDADEAASWLARAEKWDPRCSLLEQTRELRAPT